MYQAVQAYAKTAQAAQTPRQVEAALLLKAASKLQIIKDDWITRQADLPEALTYNRKLWTVLVTSATEASNPLPRPIKQNIGNLGIFIFKHTIGLLAEPRPERLDVLVTINRELAAGLRTVPQAA